MSLVRRSNRLTEIVGLALVIFAAGCSDTMDDDPPTPSAPLLKLAELDASASHACGLTADGRAFCFGDNTHGELGTGDKTPLAGAPLAVSAGGAHFVQIETGDSFTCALAGPTGSTELDAMCWGTNEHGELGKSGTEDATIPGLVDSTEKFSNLSAGNSHACAVSSGNEVWCWGRNEAGQLGRGSTSPFERAPQKINMNLIETGVVSGVASFVQVSAGELHTCALASNGTPYCWGSDANGQLGIGAGDDSNTEPRKAVDLSVLATGESFIRIASGGRHTCGLTNGGVPYCWGENSSGQLGDGTKITAQNPSRMSVGDAKFFTQLSAGDAHTCGLTMSKIAYCWGSNARGQFGDGSELDESADPIAVDATELGADVFLKLASATGGDYTCGLTAAGDTFCWGTADAAVLDKDAGEHKKPLKVLRGD